MSDVSVYCLIKVGAFRLDTTLVKQFRVRVKIGLEQLFGRQSCKCSFKALNKRLPLCPVPVRARKRGEERRSEREGERERGKVAYSLTLNVFEV